METVRGLRTLPHFVSISDLAKRLGVTPRALRYYQDRGLIRSHRLARNMRAYDLETVAIVETIVAFRDVDLPISAIAEILSLRDDPAACAKATCAALAEARADKERGIARIDAMLGALVAPVDSPRPLATRSEFQPPPLACGSPGDMKEGVSR